MLKDGRGRDEKMDKVEMVIKILLMEVGAEEKEAEFYAKEFDDYFIEIAETFSLIVKFINS